MKRNSIVLAVVIVTVATMVYFAAHKSRNADMEAVAGSARISGDVKGKVAPDFELKTLDGKTVHLSDYRGKAVLLNFWATWCGPCKIEMPWFVDLQKQYGPQGFEIVGIAMDDSSDEQITSFAREMGVNYTIVRGKEATAESFGGIMGLPVSFFIGRDGKIVDRSIGLVGHDEIEENIKTALARGVSTSTSAKN